MCKKNVLVFSFDSINNAGDTILGDATVYLVRTAMPEASIVRCQLKPQPPFFRRALASLVVRFLKIIRLADTLTGRAVINRVICFRDNPRAYYEKLICGATHIIFAVGSMNYRQCNLDGSFDEITKIAERMSVPVMISAIHVSEPDVNDPRFVRFKDAVNRKCVKVVTTRDGKQGVLNFNKIWRCSGNECQIDYVGDPALWIPEVYNQSRIIGVSLIRHGLLSEYGSSYDDEFALNLYVEVIHEIERRGYRWQLFSNGVQDDAKFGKELVRRIGGNWRDVAVAKSGASLAKIIRKYDAIVAGRMHAMLTAASMAIPFVGFAWDSKIPFVFDPLGCGDNLVTMKDLSAGNLMNKLDRVLHVPYERGLMDLRRRTLSYISEFISNY